MADSESPYKKLPQEDQNQADDLGERQHSIFEDMPNEKRQKLFYIIIFTIAIIIIEWWIRNPFNRLSEWIQEQYFFPGQCKLADILIYFKYEGKVVIFLILYNVSNIYTSLSMVILDSIGVFIEGTVKLLYLDPRPFWANEKLYPCICATNYGLPSCTTLNVYLVAVVLYKGLINQYRTKWWRALIIFFFLFPQAFAWAARFLQNAHSIDQLLFGLLFGYVIQYVYFEILEVDLESMDQMKRIINSTGLLLLLAGSTFAWFIFNFIHYTVVEIEYNPEHLRVIEKYCDTVPFEMFDNESYQKTAIMFLFIGSVLGILLEYRYVFKNKFMAFARYNMLQSRWNATDSKKTFLRILIMYLTFLFLQKVGRFGDPEKDSIIYLTFGRYIVLYFSEGVFFFFFIKFIFKYLNLTNENLEEDELKSSLTMPHQRNKIEALD